MSYGHASYHARFSPKKATFASTSSPSQWGVPVQRTISEVGPPPPFWNREEHHPRSASNPTSSVEVRSGVEPTSARSNLDSSHLPPTFASPRVESTPSLAPHSTFQQQQPGLLPSPMMESFDPFSPVHNHPMGASSFEPGFIRRGSQTPSYASITSSASSFTCSPYPPPPQPQRPQRPPSSALAFVFPSHPPPPPPTSAGTRAPPPAPLLASKTSYHATGTSPHTNDVIAYSPFFRDEETDEDLTSYYFTSQSSDSSSVGGTPFRPEEDSYAADQAEQERPSTMYSIQTTPTASPVTPKFPKRAPSQMSDQEKYRDDLRAYTRGLLRGVHRAASEPCEEVGMAAWTKAGGVQEDVDMENGDSMEHLVGGSLGRRVRRKGRNASEGGKGFREVAVCE